MSSAAPRHAPIGERSSAKARDLERAGLLLTFAGVVFLLTLVILESIYPGYSVHSNSISDLLAIGTSTSLIGEPILFLVALTWMAGVYYLFRNTGETGRMVLYLLPGLGLMLAVLSPENVNVVIHSVGAILAFVPGSIAVILSYRMIGSRFRYFAIVLGVLGLAGTALYFGAYETPSIQQTLGTGGWERVIVYPLLIWLIGFGSYLLAKSAESPKEELQPALLEVSLP
ncbi:MAG: DUF998 domain-containing protein [Thermoplasmata archaeon]